MSSLIEFHRKDPARLKSRFPLVRSLSQTRTFGNSHIKVLIMTTHSNAIPLGEAAAAHLAHHQDVSFMALPRFPTRPPSYTEQDMADSPPTYVDVIKRKMKAVQTLPAKNIQSPRVRLCNFVFLALCLIVIVVVPIATLNGSDNF